MKRWISMVLACCMLLSMVTTAGAGTTGDDLQDNPTEGREATERAVSAEVLDSGYCGGEGDGTNLTWTLTADGTLTIDGTGRWGENKFSYDAHVNDIFRVVVGEGVTNIGRGAFSSFKKLTDITFPNSITEIGSWAFQSSGLRSVTIPEGLVSIGEEAFAGCASLKHVEIPASFSEAISEQIVGADSDDRPEGLGYSIFGGCDMLLTVTIRGNFKEFSWHSWTDVFQDCERFSEVILDENNPWLCSVDGVVFSKDRKTLVYYPTGHGNNYIVPDGVEHIADYAFYEAGVSKVALPEGLVSIGRRSFDGTDIWYIVIPASVTSIGYGAFFVTGEGHYYFCGDAPSVDGNAFGNRWYGSGVSTFYYLEGTDGWPEPGDDYRLWPDFTLTADGITASGDCGDHITWTFDYATGVLKLTGYGEMWSAQEYFYGDDPFYQNGAFLLAKRIEIGSGITKLGPMDQWLRLEEIFIPSSVEEIGDSGLGYFNGCTALKNIVVSNENERYYSKHGALFERRNSGGDDANNLLRYPAGKKQTQYEIPEGTEMVWCGVFAQADRLEAVSMPDSVKAAGSECFCLCRNLKTVALSQNMDMIDVGVFQDCFSLESIAIPGTVTTIGDAAFGQCVSLEQIWIPEHVKVIGQNAFQLCHSLKEVVIEGKLDMLGNGAFVWCTSLTDIYFLDDAPADMGNPFEPGAETVIHYLEGKSGWTDSEYYNPEKGTWRGYKLTARGPEFYLIKSLQPDGIVINGRGYGRLPYQVMSYDGTSMAGQEIRYTLEGKRYTTVSDGNGQFFVTVPETGASKTYSLHFTLPGVDGAIRGADHSARVTVTPLSYSQKWSGVLGVGAEVGIGPGFTVGAGDIFIEANAAKVCANGKVSGELSLEDSYDSDGRTLEVNFQSDKSVGTEFKSGVEATLPTTEIDVIKASVGAKLAAQNSVGLKIKNYSPQNVDQAIDLGFFLLEAAVLSSPSVIMHQITELRSFDAHNQSGYGNKVILDAGASIGTVEEVNGETNEFSLLGADAAVVIAYRKTRDFLDDTSNQTLSLGCDLGLNVLGGVALPAGGNVFNSLVGNNFAMSANFDGNDELAGLSFKADTSGSGEVLWFEQTVEDSVTLSFAAREAKRIAEDNRMIGKFVEGSQTLFDPESLIGVALDAERGDYLGSATQSRAIKEGSTLSFPIGFGVGVSATGKLSGTFAEAFEYAHHSGISLDGNYYETAVSTVTQNEFESQRKKLTDIIGEALDAAADYLKKYFVRNLGEVADGVVTGFAELTGTEEWFAEIGMIDQKGGSRSSFAILVLASPAAPASTAATAVTVGDPYSVAVYTDSAGETLVSEKALSASPLSLTLGYDWSMLQAAGVDENDDIVILWFDNERNTYVPVADCVQDKENMTVTAPVTAHGEHILAVDNASPLVSDFALSDLTATPTISFLVSDLSGIGEFSFWMEGGNELVGTEDFESCYSFDSNVFTYTFDHPLTSGEKTVYVQAADTLGNANTEPFSFTFLIDAEAPVISDVVITDETDEDSAVFNVTARVFDHDGVTQVVLNVTTDSGKTSSVPMTETEDGVWSADVTELDGVSEMYATVAAFDWSGNRSESGPYTVMIDGPAESDAISFHTEWTDCDENIAVAVTVKADSPKVVEGWLLCALYDQDGKMTDIDCIRIGLQATDEQTHTLTFDCDAEDVCSGSVFFVDVEVGYTPLCERFDFPAGM